LPKIPKTRATRQFAATLNYSWTEEKARHTVERGVSIGAGGHNKKEEADRFPPFLFLVSPPVPNCFSARKNTPKKGRLISQAPFPIYVIGQMAQ
jgi:hypothetical protein